MKNTRRKHSAAFKTEAVLEAIKEQKTLSELAQEYRLTTAQISAWKSELSIWLKQQYNKDPGLFAQWKLAQP